MYSKNVKPIGIWHCQIQPDSALIESCLARIAIRSIWEHMNCFSTKSQTSRADKKINYQKDVYRFRSLYFKSEIQPVREMVQLQRFLFRVFVVATYLVPSSKPSLIDSVSSVVTETKMYFSARWVGNPLEIIPIHRQFKWRYAPMRCAP